jgi:hypothetical protein
MRRRRRLSVVSMLANLVIEASRFEAIARPSDASTVADPRRSDPVFVKRVGRTPAHDRCRGGPDILLGMVGNKRILRRSRLD